MKKIILILILIAYCSMLTVNCKAQWVSINNGTTEILRSVKFVNADTGWVVSDIGSIIKTTDGGKSWINQNSGATHGLFSCYFINANLGYAVGYSGTILKTTNGGNTWLKLYLNISEYEDLYSVYFTSAETGYTCSDWGHVFKTINGGNTWIKQNIDSNQHYSSIYFPTTDIGYVVSEDSQGDFPAVILKTADGGNHWVLSDSIPRSEGSYLMSVYFLDSISGYVAGGYSPSDTNCEGGFILKTLDGGKHWVRTNFNTSLISIYFINLDTGYCVGGLNGPTVIYRTIDAGKNWELQNFPRNTDCLVSVFLANKNIGYSVGFTGAMLKTTNGGDWVNELRMENGELRIYPNPVNQLSVISYQLSIRSLVNIKVYDITGREIETVENTVKEQGSYKINYNSQNLDNGVYFIKLTTNDGFRVVKFIKE